MLWDVEVEPVQDRGSRTITGPEFVLNKPGPVRYKFLKAWARIRQWPNFIVGLGGTCAILSLLFVVGFTGVNVFDLPCDSTMFPEEAVVTLFFRYALIGVMMTGLPAIFGSILIATLCGLGEMFKGRD